MKIDTKNNETTQFVRWYEEVKAQEYGNTTELAKVLFLGVVF
jgi:hypothetical protein